MKTHLVKIVLAFLFIAIVVSCKKKDEPNIDNNAAQTINNVSYGSHARNKMDVYLPANRDTENTKLFIWIHGGAWSDGDKGEFANIKPTLDVYLDNYAYVALNYRLFDTNSNQNKFPSQEEDMQAAIAFIKTKLEEWKISDKVVLAGGSAGGHLALLQAFKHNDDGFLKAAVAYFPPTELVSFYPYNWFSTLVLSALTGGAPDDYPELYQSSSPINYLTSSSIPTIFFHGTADDVVPISQSYMLKDSLEHYGVPHDYMFVNGEGHNFSTGTTIQSIQQAADFLDLHNP